MAGGNIPDNIPDMYNGKPTKYRLFDGFVYGSTAKRALYIASALFSVFTVPVIIELLQASKTRKNADAAREAMAVEQQNARAVQYGTAPMEYNNLNLGLP